MTEQQAVTELVEAHRTMLHLVYDMVPDHSAKLKLLNDGHLALNHLIDAQQAPAKIKTEKLDEELRILAARVTALEAK